MRQLLAALALVLSSAGALAQDVPAIHHHEGMSAAVDRFYSTWFMPDKPAQSCCNKVDCYIPEQTKQEGGHWWFIRREDRAWIRVPAAKVEQNRDSPDGLTHVCARTKKRLAAVAVECRWAVRSQNAPRARSVVRRPI